MKRLSKSKAVLALISCAHLIMSFSCSKDLLLSDNEKSLAESKVTVTRSVLSADSPISVSNMSNNNITFKYNAGSQKTYARLFVSEGNGLGLVLANKDMSYSNGVYSYTVNHHTFKNNAKIYFCVLENNGGREVCLPSGNLAQSSSWTYINYGQSVSSNSSSSSSSSSSGSTISGSNGSISVNSMTNKSVTIEYNSSALNYARLFVSEGNGKGLVLANKDMNYSNGKYSYTVSHPTFTNGAKIYVTVLANNYAGEYCVPSGYLSDVNSWASFNYATSSSSSSSSGSSSSGSSNNNSNLIEGATNGTSVGTYGSSFIAYDNNFDTLVWSDEFEGNYLKSENWVYDTGAGGWGNSELQTYTNGGNVSVSGGAMKIEARSDLTSTRIKSAGRKTFKYGKIESRIKCSQGVGSWPAFWMLGTGANYQWPYCGEIDIMEHANYDNFVYQTCHWNSNGSNTWTPYAHAYWGQTTNNNYWNVISNFDVSQWHTYGIEWTSSIIKFFVDGIQVMACDIGNPSIGTDAFNNEFYLIYNFAMGGQFTGIYDRNQFSNMPWAMYVDYVRVYQ